MLLFPFPVPISTESPELADRVEQLETALVLSLGVLQSVVERLESRLGPGFLGDELEQLAIPRSEAKQQVTEIDSLIQQGNKPKAARLIRELTGLTWDQAHHVVGQWNSCDLDDRVRWFQLTRWVKALSDRSVEPGSSAT